MNILRKIGTPALLEQLAEESAELAQAALKLSRAMRHENPTPKTQSECFMNLEEEIADVLLCLDILHTRYFNAEDVKRVMEIKRRRWENRLSKKNLQAQEDIT